VVLFQYPTARLLEGHLRDLVGEVEKQARREMRHEEKEAKKVRTEVEKVVRRLIEQVEKLNPIEEVDGEMYADYIYVKGASSISVPVHKVRGDPCKEWFAADSPLAREGPLTRNEELEAEVKRLIKSVKGKGIPIQPPFKLANAAEWVSPDQYDGNWMKIHIRSKPVTVAIL